MCNEIFDFAERERAGALLVHRADSDAGPLLAVLRWMPVLDEYIIDTTRGLTYDGRFHLRVAEQADALNAGAMLIHAHRGQAPPRPSHTDAERGEAFLTFMRRRRPDATHGLLVLGADTITGVISEPSSEPRDVERLVAAGLPTREWRHEPRSALDIDDDDRQLLAVGAAAQSRLANATIAVIGNSGGGSHVTQQLIHAGVGTLIVIDPDIVSATNLRRLVGAHLTDIDTTMKVEIARRTAAAVRRVVNVKMSTERFPSTATLAALRTADIIIGCVDGWDTRDDLNTFALASRIPYIDVGISIAPPTGILGMRVGGQVAVVIPGRPCLRCIGLVTDNKVDLSRQRRQGYSDVEPEPQVVSLNGTVASEAVTAALMLLAEDDRIVPYRRYAFPPGKIVEVQAQPRKGCSACRSAHIEHPDTHAVIESPPAQSRSRFGRWLRRLTNQR